MSLMDKIKYLFTDEIETEEDIELEEDTKIYDEPKDVLPKVMRDTIKESEEVKFSEKLDLGFDKIDMKLDLPKEIKVEKNTSDKEKKFSFPIDFEDDFVPKRQENINVLDLEKKEEKVVKEVKEPVQKKKYNELYQKKDVHEKPKFIASPVISPVYGVLDKNYKKEEVKEKNEDTNSLKRPSKTVDFETVRKKAFGNLSDDIKDKGLCESCELYREVKKIDKKNKLKEDDLLYEMTVDNDKTLTLENAYDNYEAFGVSYDMTREGRRRARCEDIIVNHNEEKPKCEEIKFKDIKKEIEIDNKEDEIEELKAQLPEKEKKNTDSKVDADFFELIESMYKERTDD